MAPTSSDADFNPNETSLMPALTSFRVVFFYIHKIFRSGEISP